MQKLSHYKRPILIALIILQSGLLIALLFGTELCHLPMLFVVLTTLVIAFIDSPKE